MKIPPQLPEVPSFMLLILIMILLLAESARKIMSRSKIRSMSGAGRPP